MPNVKARLNRLEARHNQSFADVLSYCLYRDCDRLGLEQVNGYFNGLHFQLERNPAPPTPTQHAETVKELEEWFRQAQAEFNAACCE